MILIYSLFNIYSLKRNILINFIQYEKNKKKLVNYIIIISLYIIHKLNTKRYREINK